MTLTTATEKLDDPLEFDRLWSELDAALVLQRKVVAPSSAKRSFPSHLMFGQGGNAGLYQLFGWNNSEIGFTWTEGAESLIELPPAEPPVNHFLNAQIAPFLTKETQCQQVTVNVGGVKVAEWAVRNPGHYFALIPGALLENAQELTFHFSQSQSPSDAGLSNDNRELALRFFQLWLTPWRSLEF